MSEQVKPDLDTCLAKQCNPLTQILCKEEVLQLVEMIDKTPDGPNVAFRFITHKIQSPQEIEALKALQVLDEIANIATIKIIQELGKFRFLNELIKVVSPKFLSYRTSPKVKQRVVELIYKWSYEFKQESKIAEAYVMLKKQGIIMDDPTYVLKEYHVPNQQTPTRASSTNVNETLYDEERVKTLQRLLQSKNEYDLQAANKLIKMMVKDVDKKIDFKCKCLSELETVYNNAKVLSDMLNNYRQNEANTEEVELITELYQCCERLRPKLFRLAAEMDEKDENLMKILEANDHLNKVLREYKQTFGLDDESKRSETSSQSSAETSAYSNDLKLLEFDNLNSVKDETMTSLNHEIDRLLNLHMQTADDDDDEGGISKPDLQCVLLPEVSKASSQTDSKVNVTKPVAKSITSLDELDCLMRQTMQANCRAKAANANAVSATRSAREEDEQPQSLTELFVPLESIKPAANIEPILLVNKNDLKVVLKFSDRSPREDVTVMVITMISSNRNPITSLLFQAAVPKNMRVKLQPPSGTCLPACNEFVPPMAITQVMLIARLRDMSDKVRFKYRLSYKVNEQQFTETDEIANLF